MIKHLYDPQSKRFIKGIYPNGEKEMTIDSSISSVFVYEVLDAKDTRVENTMKALASGLQVKTDIGGLARYQNDHYRQFSSDTPGTHGLSPRSGLPDGTSPKPPQWKS